MAQVVLSVPDISCGHCERTVREALAPLQGVRSVAVNLPAKKVQVEYDESTVGVERMKEVLQEEDYPVASVTTVG